MVLMEMTVRLGLKDQLATPDLREIKVFRETRDCKDCKA
jgi:hypothetical protein